MTFAYTYAKTSGNNILFRGYRDGKHIIEKVPFKPTLYTRSQTNTSGWQDIRGNNLEPVKFGSIKEAKDYIKQFDGVSNFEVHGNTSYNYQFLKETFPGKIKFDFKMTKVLLNDIETEVFTGFPDSMNPMERVILITVINIHDDSILTFGLKDVKTELPNATYLKFETEEELLKAWVIHMQNEKPDIISGWYSDSFDYPYLAARIEKILGEDWVSRISPFEKWYWDDFEKEDGSVDRKVEFVGITILDYLQLYKKFSGEKHEEYSLGFVSEFQLGITKVDNPYDSFADFIKDEQLFYSYNVRDVTLLNDMDKKMRLFELVLTAIYRAKCNVADSLGTTKLWECKIHDYLYDNKIATPNYAPNQSKSLMGAYVKEPLAGRYEWEVSVDAEALYPCIIMSWNISPETLLPRMADCTVDGVLSRTLNTEGLTMMNATMAANGAMFTKSKRGFIPSIIEAEFSLRKQIKNDMLDTDREIQEITEELKLRGEYGK